MKIIIAQVLLLFSILHQESFCFTFETKYIEVPVDHFSFTTNATFKLKYLVNDSFWVDEGPIFFYTGNEGTIESFAENTGFIFDIAPAFNALIVFAEHRFYGESLPFGNASYDSLSHVGYLTSTQALADYVEVINELQSHYLDSDVLDKLPVVAFGGSYGGMLASWLRMKYPSSVIGAIASSAPIWQFEGITPCENFNRITTDVFKLSAVDFDCTSPIKESWKAIRNISSTAAGREWISAEWKLCTNITAEETDKLVNWFSGIIFNLAMVNYPYPTSFLMPLPAEPVKAFCTAIGDTTGFNTTELLSAFGRALEIYTNYTQTSQCNDIAITSPDLGERGWDFQACTEMIMPMCSTDLDMFENYAWNFESYAAGCFDRWKVKQNNPYLPVWIYGGKNIDSYTNIVFSNGLLDPWSSGGVLSNVSSSVSAVVIPEAAHHLDLRSENELDPPSVIEARRFHVHSIKLWISEFYFSRYEQFFDRARYYEKVEYLHKNHV